MFVTLIPTLLLVVVKPNWAKADPGMGKKGKKTLTPTPPILSDAPSDVPSVIPTIAVTAESTFPGMKGKKGKKAAMMKGKKATMAMKGKKGKKEFRMMAKKTGMSPVVTNEPTAGIWSDAPSQVPTMENESEGMGMTVVMTMGGSLY